MKQALEYLMGGGRCEREPEVLREVRAGRWPQAADEELRHHAASCAVCADAVLVAQCLAREARLEREAPLPHPGLIWWRAEIMARRDAAGRATRPIAIAEWIGIACGLALAFAAVIFEWPKVHASALKPGVASRLGEVVAGFASAASSTVVMMSVGACLALALFVLYIVWAESSR